MNDDTISRREAIDALWEALYEYEDKTKKQFQESDELDVEDWILHRVFVQNMSDIDRRTILDLPSAQQWIPVSERQPEETNLYWVTVKPIDSEMLEVTQRWYFGRGYGDGWEAELYEPPLAWMPMEWPEPWRGEDDE